MCVQKKVELNDNHDGLLKDYAEAELVELMGMIEEVEGIDKELYNKILKRISHLTKQSKMVHKNSRRQIKVAKKLSLSNKKCYYKISKKIIKLLKDDSISEEIKIELTKILREVISYLDVADIRDKEFLNTTHKKVLSYGGVMLVTVAAIYGVKTKK